MLKTSERFKRSELATRMAKYHSKKHRKRDVEPVDQREEDASFSVLQLHPKWLPKPWDSPCPHAALAPSGQKIWLEMARQSAQALHDLHTRKLTLADILTDDSIHNALAVHAACGGSTNLLLHIPAVAHAAGLKRPTAEDWTRINRQVARFVDVLPNGPMYHPTIRLFMAGGVPEIMWHLREMGIARCDARTVSGPNME